MSQIHSSTFELTGAREGQDLNWRDNFQFIGGKCTVRAGREQLENIRRYLSANLQVREVKHDASQSQDRGGRPDAPEGAGGADVHGGAAAGAATRPPQPGATAEGGPQDDPVLSKIRLALLQMDRDDDSQWTKDGRPTLATVEKLAGTGAVTRSQLEAAMPGFTRKGGAA